MTAGELVMASNAKQSLPRQRALYCSMRKENWYQLVAAMPRMELLSLDLPLGVPYSGARRLGTPGTCRRIRRMAQARIGSKAKGHAWKTPPARSGADYPRRSEWRHGTGQRRGGRWPSPQLLPWLLGGCMGFAQPAWAARGTSFRGQWSLGNLIGALVILAILAGLVAFFMWPRRRS